MQNLSPVWKSKVINRETKTRVYEALVLSVLLYNSETWTLKESTKKKLLVFEMGCLRRIKGVTRRDRIRNVDIREELKIKIDIVQRIQRKRLRYFGHNEQTTIHSFIRACSWREEERTTKETMDQQPEGRL